MNDIKLIVNADDGNLTPGVVQGVLRAHDRGIVTSTTVFSNFPLTDELKKEFGNRPKLGVGLHLNITLGLPVAPASEVKSLLVNGEFVKHDADYFRKIDRHALRLEYKAQIEKFSLWLHRLPTHLDTHHHLHRYAPIFETIVDLAEEYQIPFRLTELVDLKTRERLEMRGVSLPDHLMAAPSIAKSAKRQTSDPWQDWGSEAQKTQTSSGSEQACFDKERLHDVLTHLPTGVIEIMTHPAEIDDALRKVSSFAEPRALELESLTQPGLFQSLEQEGIDLINYNALKKKL